MMDAKPGKVYVAVGNNLVDGLATLEWVLKKWSSHSITIVIIHATTNILNQFVYTPLGKLPASSARDESLEAFRMYEQEKINNQLSQYIAFCGKIKTRILPMEKTDEPIHEQIVELISSFRITKLVMGMTFLKSSSRKSRGSISGSFYVHRHKPDYCELFVICGGKLVSLREVNDEGLMEDDQGNTVARMREKAPFICCLGKVLFENSFDGRYSSFSSSSPTNKDSVDSHNQWENNFQELEKYFQELLSSKSDDEDCPRELNKVGPIEANMLTLHQNRANKIEDLRVKLNEAHETIELMRRKAKENVKRQEKARWALNLCSQQTEEFEARTNEEITNRMEIKKDLDRAKENIYEIISDIEESKSRLRSIIELQSELSNKLQISTIAKSSAESQLEKEVTMRVDMLRQIEELRRQRDVIHRRIEFCREKDAIGMATRITELTCSYKEYTAEEIRFATDNFAERLRLKSGNNWTNVYRARIKHTTVAIKRFDSVNSLSPELFQAKVKLLGSIRHPHLVAMMGFSSELRCIVFEYMHHGSLEDILFPSKRISPRRNRALYWQDRLRVMSQVSSGLSFLHPADRKPIFHGNLNPSNVLLDRYLVAKVHGLNPKAHAFFDESEVIKDVTDFGLLMVQLLTGRSWARPVEEIVTLGSLGLVGMLDEVAGSWPSDLAEELAGIAIRCLSVKVYSNWSIASVMRALDVVKRKADDLVSPGDHLAIVGGKQMEDPEDVPRVFLCPIFQEVMKNPHIVADGFSYELEAIQEWLRMGHNTSPMTNLSLKHKNLIPNHTLRSLILEWQNKRSTQPP